MSMNMKTIQTEFCGTSKKKPATEQPKQEGDKPAEKKKCCGGGCHTKKTK